MACEPTIFRKEVSVPRLLPPRWLWNPLILPLRPRYAVCRSFASGARPSIGMYNFGSPRVGNSAFVRRYNSLVPDSWRVLNPRDMVTPHSQLVTLEPSRR